MTAAAQPADGAVAFSASQCAVLRQMRVDTQGQCPARSTPPMRSLQADEASYNPGIGGIGGGGTGAGGVGGRPAGGAGYAGDSAGGAAGAAPGAGVPGAPDEPEKPGSGGGGGVRPGSGRPPVNPPGIIVVKPGGGTVVIERGDIFDGKIDSKQEVRRALIIRRKRGNDGGGDFFNPSDPPKGNSGKHLGQSRQRQGRNSK